MAKSLFLYQFGELITLINNVWESEAIVGEASVQIGKGIKNVKERQLQGGRSSRVVQGPACERK